MAYKVKNPKNVILLVESLRKAELYVQNIKNAAECPLVAFNADEAEANLAQLHKCVLQMAQDLGVEESTITDRVVTQAWPGGK